MFQSIWLWKKEKVKYLETRWSKVILKEVGERKFRCFDINTLYEPVYPLFTREISACRLFQIPNSRHSNWCLSNPHKLGRVSSGPRQNQLTDLTIGKVIARWSSLKRGLFLFSPPGLHPQTSRLCKLRARS